MARGTVQQDMNKPKKTLRDEMREYSRGKKWLVPLLIVLGLVGLVLPVLPGLALIVLGLLMLFPREGNALLNRLKQLFR